MAGAIQPTPLEKGSGYVSGACNIGPKEIEARRRSGYTGTVATVVLLIVLVVLDAPPFARLLLIIPAAVAASGFIQARLRFCAGFGFLGIFNFGDLGTQQRVEDKEQRRRDRVKAVEIGLASFVFGVVVAVAAIYLPF
jgi:hypothetical protein